MIPTLPRGWYSINRLLRLQSFGMDFLKPPGTDWRPGFFIADDPIRREASAMGAMVLVRAYFFAILSGLTKHHQGKTQNLTPGMYGKRWRFTIRA